MVEIRSLRRAIVPLFCALHFGSALLPKKTARHDYLS